MWNGEWLHVDICQCVQFQRSVSNVLLAVLNPSAETGKFYMAIGNNQTSVQVSPSNNNGYVNTFSLNLDNNNIYILNNNTFELQMALYYVGSPVSGYFQQGNPMELKVGETVIMNPWTVAIRKSSANYETFTMCPSSPNGSVMMFNSYLFKDGSNVNLSSGQCSNTNPMNYFGTAVYIINTSNLLNGARVKVMDQTV